MLTSQIGTLVLELFAGGFWLAAYILLTRRGFRDMACGMPMTALCMNLSNEFITTFFYPPGQTFQLVVYAGWLVVDGVLFWQLVCYRRADPIPNLPDSLFYPAVIVILTLTFVLTFMAFHEFDDVRAMTPPYGCLFAGYGAALLMGVLFVSMLVRRKDLGGQSLYIGLCKMLGTLSYSLLYIGFMRSSPLIFSMMILTTFFDLLYVLLYFVKCNQLRVNAWSRV